MKAEPVSIQGLAYGRVRFVSAHKHGQHTRYVEVDMDHEVILKLADCIRGCHGVYEDTSTGEKPRDLKHAQSDPKFVVTWIAHAVWHLQHPESLMPCLQHDANIIDVPGLLPAKDAKP